MTVYMPDNELDNIFKHKIGEIDKLPQHSLWEIENSWQRFRLKKKKKAIHRIYFYAAAILILGFFAEQIIISEFYKGESSIEIENSMSEYQKRQKLAEIEAKMSGNYYSVKICSVCEDIFYQSIKADKPVQYRYFQIN